MKITLSEHIHDINYHKMRMKNPPESVEALPKGVWVPISIAAYLLKYSGQTLRLMIMTRQLKALKFPVGPILVNIEKYMVEREEK